MALAAGVGVAYVVSSRHPKLLADSRILLIGDSLALGLAPHLRALAEEAGLPFRAVAQKGTAIRDWGGIIETTASQRLQEALSTFQPTLVLVSLGTNDELFEPAVVVAEQDDLAALFERLDDYEVAWIGVPTLPVQTAGAARMIRDTGVPYFPSERLELRRAPDGLHPTVGGYAAWAGALWSWLT